VQSAYAKAGKTRHVPMNAKLRGALAALKEKALGETIFTRRDGAPLTARSGRPSRRHAGMQASRK